jgi:alpha-L-fucosidase
MNRRTALRRLAGTLPVLAAVRAIAGEETNRAALAVSSAARDPFRHYQIPRWFHDAKFGIWAHWGPQSAPEYGDWYARNIYIQNTRQNRFHVQHYGHPSRFGYKDIIQTWKGDLFDPDHLVGLYQKAGAKYFLSMGVHVDNFDLWNSTHTRWNSVNFGVRQDVVGRFREAARRHNLKFGVSDHLWMAYKWMSVTRGSDKDGPLAGVPYDGVDPQYVDLYGDCQKIYRNLPWDEDDIPEKWKHHWYLRIKDLIDQYEPDLLYSDGQIPFGQWGLDLVAHFYQQNALRHGGQIQAVYTSKRKSDSDAGLCVFDKERGVVDGIWPKPWQIDTCVGNWHYDREAKYKTPKRVIDMLVDVVSRNGNLLLNFPLNNRGVLDAEETKILEAITAWMSINGEAIFATRPWKIFGEGPTVQKSDPSARYNETSRKDFTADDVRFTSKAGSLYAFLMGWPATGRLSLAPLAPNRELAKGRIQRVSLLGGKQKLTWSFDESGLKVVLPAEKPCDYACALRIEGLENVSEIA